MADLTHIHANQIRRKHFSTQAVAWVGAVGAVACGATGLWPGALVFGALWAGAGGTLAVNGKKWCSGWQGEARALRTLRELPDDCTLLNQVRIPCEGASTGWLEADFMAVTPRGVYIVEAKNHRGTIMVDGNGNWSVAGMDGVARPARNGARQALRQAAVAGQWLRNHGVRTWIEPIVCATHPETVVSDSNGTQGVPVTKPEILLPRLLDDSWQRTRAPARLDAAARTRIVQALVAMDNEARHGIAAPGRTADAARVADSGGYRRSNERAATRESGSTDVGAAPASEARGVGGKPGLRSSLAEAACARSPAPVAQVVPINEARARRRKP